MSDIIEMVEIDNKNAEQVWQYLRFLPMSLSMI